MPQELLFHKDRESRTSQTFMTPGSESQQLSTSALTAWSKFRIQQELASNYP